MLRILLYLLFALHFISCKKQTEFNTPEPLHGAILRGPYLQKAAPGSITIIFYTATPSRSTLLISNGKERQFILQKPTLRHAYHLTGLDPGSTYTYLVKAGNYKWQGEEHWHFTMPGNNKDTPFRFWATGDFGAGNEDQIKVRKSFEAYLQQHPVDFWLWLGDNVYSDGSQREYFRKVFDDHYGYDSIMKFLPFYPTPGNHDYQSVNRHGGNIHRHEGPYYDLVEVFEQGEGGGTPSGTELYYSFDYGNTHFVSLNSEVWRFSVLGHQQMRQWLEKDLKTNRQKWTVVYFHQPPYSFGSHRSDTRWEVVMRGMRSKYLPIIEKYGVDLVLCGHSHVYERSFLLEGHYKKTKTIEEEHIVSKGKMINGVDVIHKKQRGTLYVVSGNSGKDHIHAPEPHPVMAFGYGGEHQCGSLIVSINGDTLSGEYLTSEGKIIDRFALVK